ncbi:MAG: ATP-dependent helicase [Proteobacteria bacterium]|nr:ATP-dependent helicase [Pseudomonadota bacterium]
MFALSSKQKEIVGLPLAPICVTACAGSGKTRTAVHRLCEVRRRLEDRHGIIALLSFSNVAVDTFRKDYFALAGVRTRGSAGVEIDTMDAFITGNILRPHAHRTMGAPRTPYLVQGREPFLRHYTVWDGEKRHGIAQLNARFVNGAFDFAASFGKGSRHIPVGEAEKQIAKFGKTGGYTHSLGRYWTLKTLADQPFLLRALARRYPHILIDEAQDIGTEHQAILELLKQHGVQISLIGDVNQGIYEFSGANGNFLSGYGLTPGVERRGLTRNFRSVPAIVTVANRLSGRDDCADRKKPELVSGAYFTTYKSTKKDDLLAKFDKLLAQGGVTADHAAILCRGSDFVAEWRGKAEAQGEGTVRAFAKACLERDKHADYHNAFRHVCAGVIALLADEHSALASLVSVISAPPEIRRAKRLIWSFMRDATAGLPACTLSAKSAWHPALVSRVKALLARLDSECGLKTGDNIGQRLAKRKLTADPLSLETSAPKGVERCRISTVHQVKGESIPAVMYVAKRKNVRDLLDGTASEEGRIGYVALTRACDLFVLAIPEVDLATFEAELLDKGLMRLTDIEECAVSDVAVTPAEK